MCIKSDTERHSNWSKHERAILLALYMKLPIPMNYIVQSFARPITGVVQLSRVWRTQKAWRATRTTHSHSERVAARHAYTLACFNIYEQGRMRGGDFAGLIGQSPAARRRVLLDHDAPLAPHLPGVLLVGDTRLGGRGIGGSGRVISGIGNKPRRGGLAHPFVVLRQTDVAFVVETKLALYPRLARNKTSKNYSL